MKKDTEVLVPTKEDALKEVSPILIQARLLKVSDEETYKQADTLRSQLQGFKKTWIGRMADIIEPAHAAWKSACGLRSEIVDPADKGIDILTRSMREYKLEEQRLFAAAILERDRKEAELRRQKEEAERKQLEAVTKGQNKLQTVLAKAAENGIKKLQSIPVSAPVKAMGSDTRKVKVWEVTNFKALLAAVVAGDIPEDVVEVNRAILNQYFKADDEEKSAIRTWPGIEVKDDVVIVSKRGM